MISRIEVRNFAVAREITVEPCPGLNIFTGETGAGKSIIIDALYFALGGRRGREIVASGAERATVSVLFASGSGPEVEVERVMGRSGRSSLRINGETARLEDLADVLPGVVDIHGQSEQLTVLRPSAQLDALDQFAGLMADRTQVTVLVRELRDVRRRLHEFTADERERERLLGQLQFEVEEIAGATLLPGEEERLRTERTRLADVGRLLERSAEAIEALDTPSLGAAVAAVAGLGSHDEAASELADLAALLETTAAELLRELDRYRDGLEDDPDRLATVDERLDHIARLRRKYGETVADVIAYGEDAARRLDDLRADDESTGELEAREASIRDQAAKAASALSMARRAAAGALVSAVTKELEQLGMGSAALTVAFACADDEDGLAATAPDYEIIGPGDTPVSGDDAYRRAFTESGIDRVDFLASFNAGESPRLLSAVASGGETSRFLLALTAVLGGSEPGRTVVLDEVDEGVGGRAGALVGQALRRLAANHQVLCITHLPQVAAYGDRHFVVSKQSAGNATWSAIDEVTGETRVDELAAMLGAITGANRAAARELLRESLVSA